MLPRQRPVLPLLLALTALSLPALAAEEAAARVPAPWAYGFKEPPAPGTPRVVPGKPGPPPADPTRHGLAGTDRRFTRAEITDTFGPADYLPDSHPAPPAIVAHGKAPIVWACARCHYFNGHGRPENAGIAGLPVDYFIEQMHAFRDGNRLSSDPRKGNTPLMIAFAQAMTEEEIRAAAEYYGAQRWTRWIRVVESERAPRTTISAGMYLPVPGGGDEPLGQRIVEVPEDPDLVEIQRDPRIGFVAYVPPGAIKRGEELVTTGGGGRTLLCVTCHGPDLRGMTLPDVGPIPALAGRSPSYLYRQLFDIQSGLRRGPKVELMKPVVANLTPDDLLAIVAYIASREP